jgi:DNA-binding NtrC family response regulator
MISHREWTAERSNYADLKLRALAEFDRAYVRSLLDHTQGNISRAARIAGLDRSNFRRIMKRSRPV